MLHITIQRVGHDTVAALIDLLRQLAEYEHLDPPDTQAQTRLRADILAPNPPVEAYVVFLGHEPVGCITLLRTYSTFAARAILYIEDLYVQEAHRLRGIGQQMFDFCATLAREGGCARLEWNVLKWNQPAIKFYKKNGGRAVDEWTWYRLETGQE